MSRFGTLEASSNERSKLLFASSVVIVVVAVVINVDDIALNECITASLPMFTVVFPKYKLAFVVTATPETTVSPINFAPVETPLPIEKIPLCMPSNRPVLEDLIAAAMNDAVRRVEKVTQEKMGGLTSGIDIPGLNLSGLNG